MVAYALAGTVDIDLDRDPLGTDKDGKPVYLKEIWPSQKEILDTIATSLSSEMFERKYADVFKGSELWNEIKVSGGDIYAWDENSTYIQHPPFFQQVTADVPSIENIHGARVLALLGDSITTDHISPAGAIPANGPAGRYLQEHNVQPRDFNSFGSRRGNDQVMTRGTFANIRLKNQLVPGVEGGFTRILPDGEQTSIYEAAVHYQQEDTPLIVIAGKEYGTGSSRDWAAKGTLLLGVKAVIAQSFERIHRSNLVGMGVLPLQFKNGQNAESLGLNGDEQYDITGLNDDLAPQSEVTVKASKEAGSAVEFKATVLLNTPVEVEYYRNGGILHTVLRRMVK